jgi:hypothetical protein
VAPACYQIQQEETHARRPVFTFFAEEIMAKKLSVHFVASPLLPSVRDVIGVSGEFFSSFTQRSHMQVNRKLSRSIARRCW